MTKSWRTILVTGAIPLLAGILILGSNAVSAVSDQTLSGRISPLASALGFAFAGLGLLALTRKKDRARLLTRTSATLLGALAIVELTLIGLLPHDTTAEWPRSAMSVFATELDLVLSPGFLATAVALASLTSSGRKRAGASVAAALGVSVAIIGASTLAIAALGLQSTHIVKWEVVLSSTLLPIIGWGLFSAAKYQLQTIALARGGPMPDTSLSAVTGTCAGLVALAGLVLFSLAAREFEDAQRLQQIERFRSVLQAANKASSEVNSLVTRSGEPEAMRDDTALERALKNARLSMGSLHAFTTLEEYQPRLNSAISQASKALTQLESVVQLRREGRTAAAAQGFAVHRISNSSAAAETPFSKLDAAVAEDIAEQSRRHASRRRNTALVLSAAGLLVAVLLGAVHLLFQRDSLTRQRSETALRRHNETLKNFAHTVAHDLRAPLRGIAGYASELDGQSHLVDARGRYCISQINSAAQNLERLIGDTLNYAQLDAETPTLTTIVLPALVASLLQQRAPEIRQHGTVVDTHFGIVTVASWERGLVQIIGNLLDNAIKYSRHAHPPRLRIETAQTPLSWRIVIHDNGVGFDMKYHDRIFGLFQRLVTTDEFEGTGAGLAIVRKITDRLGGTVVAEGRPGGGATFLVELPRIVSNDLA